MTKVNIRNPFHLSDDKRHNAIQDLIAYFELERGETIGVIAAEDIINKVIQSIGNQIYNAGINDASLRVEEQLSFLESDLNALKK